MDCLFHWLITKKKCAYPIKSLQRAQLYICIKSIVNQVQIEIQKVNLGSVCFTQLFLLQFTFIVSAKYLLSVTLKKVLEC